MSKDTLHRRQDLIAEEAAEWFLHLADADARTRIEFAAWLKTSPEHVEEFLAVAALWDALPEVSAQPSSADVIALAQSDYNVVTLAASCSDVPQATEVEAKTTRLWRFGLVAAATVAAIAVGAAYHLMQTRIDPNLYTTAIGEQSSVSLADGSIVTLNTQSQMRVEYSGSYRDIHLLQGEALFDVAKDGDRPFQVITEHAVVTAVGTQFNVRSDFDDVTVTVVEGEVDVIATSPLSLSSEVVHITGKVSNDPQHSVSAPSGPTRLTVGQQAKVASRSGEVAVVETTIDRATAWRERRLVFEGVSLSEVIDEFNRYNDPPLVIEDDALRALPINGVFRSNDRSSFVEFLEQMDLAESRIRSDGTIVLRALEH